MTQRTSKIRIAAGAALVAGALTTFVVTSAYAGTGTATPTITAHYDTSITSGSDLAIHVRVAGPLPGEPGASSAVDNGSAAERSPSQVGSSQIGSSQAGSSTATSSSSGSFVTGPSAPASTTTASAQSSTHQSAPESSNGTSSASATGSSAAGSSAYSSGGSSTTCTPSTQTIYPTVTTVITATTDRPSGGLITTTSTSSYTITSTTTVGCDGQALRAGAGALLAAPTLVPARGTVSVWTQGVQIGSATLDENGEADILARTSELSAGTYQLSIRYHGGADLTAGHFADAAITGPLSVRFASGAAPSSSAAASPATGITVTSDALAETGTDTQGLLAAAAMLLLAGGALMLSGRTRASGRHR